ncbi:MAG: hypothetical protein V4597_19310 [Pseudomonadota bacterium]
MTASTMSDMPAPTNTVNGFHPTLPTLPGAAAPAQPPRAPDQAELDRKRHEARAARIKIMRTEGPIVRWILRGIYLLALITAGIGQATGLMTKLHLVLLLALIPVIATEALAVAFAAVAAYRRKLGENAYLAFSLAVTFSGFAVWVNWYGHHDTQPFLAYFFAMFSAAGFVVFVIESAFARRDSLLLQNQIDDPPPVYGLWLQLTQPRLVARAKELAVKNPGLGRGGSLELARITIAADARRKAMQRVIKADLARVLGADNANLMMSVIDPDLLTDEIQSQSRLGELAGIYARRIDPAQIEAAHAAEAAKRRRSARVVRVATPDSGLAGGATGASQTSSRTSTAQNGANRASSSTRKQPAKGATEPKQKRPAAVLLQQYDDLTTAEPALQEQAKAERLGVSYARLGQVLRDAGRRQSTS